MPCTWAGFCHIDEDKPELLEILASPLMKRAEVVKQLVNTQSDSVLSSPSKRNDEGRWSKTTSVFQTKTRTGIVRPTQTAVHTLSVHVHDDIDFVTMAAPTAAITIIVDVMLGLECDLWGCAVSSISRFCSVSAYGRLLCRCHETRILKD